MVAGKQERHKTLTPKPATNKIKRDGLIFSTCEHLTFKLPSIQHQSSQAPPPLPMRLKQKSNPPIITTAMNTVVAMAEPVILSLPF
jgi:hypothetical protein